MLEASAGTGKTFTIAALAARYVAEGTPLDAAAARDVHAHGHRASCASASGSASSPPRRASPARWPARRPAPTTLVERCSPTARSTRCSCATARLAARAGRLRRRDDRDDPRLLPGGARRARHRRRRRARRRLRRGRPRPALRRRRRPLRPPLPPPRHPRLRPQGGAADRRRRRSPTRRRRSSRTARRRTRSRRCASASRRPCARELERRKRALGRHDLRRPPHPAARARWRATPTAQRLRERYSVVLVDEFQDTDPVQWDIMRRAFGDGDVDARPHRRSEAGDLRVPRRRRLRLPGGRAGGGDARDARRQLAQRPGPARRLRRALRRRAARARGHRLPARRGGAGQPRRRG